jgi:putative PEP-CTERM system histidine kinase
VVLPAVALGGVAAFDMLLHAETALFAAASEDRGAARAVLAALAMTLVVLGVLRDRRLSVDPPVSREVVFHGATLVVAGIFLTVVGVMGEALRHLGPDWAPTLRAALFGAAGIGLVLALATTSFRSRLRRLVVDHFHRARFDYRREWLRCAETLSAPDDEMPAGMRAIRAVADAVDSPAGVLLLRRGESGPLEWARSWNRPARALSLARGHALHDALAEGSGVAVLAPGMLPELQAEFGPLWLAASLAHHRLGLVGVVLLAPPRAPFPLDREAFDLLRTLGQEVAMFLAERDAAERLVDQRRVHDYARQFAFVAHDVKTVASQLSMLLSNAEDNIADPEFQRDMLVTVRASAERIRGLIGRLPSGDGHAGTATAPRPTPCIPLARLRALAAARRHPLRIEEEGSGSDAVAAMGAEDFDTAVGHLIDNAIEASAAGQAVRVRLRRLASRLVIDVTDHGSGMSPEFIRDELFRPLGTTKPRGSGIGTWQARELLRAAGGDLTVLSRPGVGTTMRLLLPTTARSGDAVREDRA